MNLKVLGITCLLTIVPVVSSSALSQTSTGTGARDTRCDIRLVLGTPGINHPRVPPAGRIRIMATRYSDLEKTLLGYEKTHVALVNYDGRVFGPSGAADDFGSFYFIPEVALHLRLSLRSSIDLFYVTILITALCLGTLGCYLTLRSNTAKILVSIELVVLMVLAYKLGDVYIMPAAVAIAFVPLALYVSETSKLAIVAPFMFAAGLAISMANAIRGHSGTGVLLFLLSLVPTRFVGGSYRKTAMVLLLVCGLLLPKLYFRRLIERRNDFLRSVCPDYPAISPAHALWHSMYIGFGYLTNDIVTSYNDQVAYDKVQSLSPGALYESPEYQQILRRQVWLLVREHPQLVVYTLAAKLGVICSIFLLFANVGWLSTKFARKPVSVELAFWLGIGFSALSGIVAVPLLTYLLGFVAFATLYGVVSLDFAVQECRKGRIRLFLRDPLLAVRGEGLDS